MAEVTNICFLDCERFLDVIRRQFYSALSMLAKYIFGFHWSIVSQAIHENRANHCRGYVSFACECGER